MSYPKYFLRSPDIRTRASQLVASLPVDQDKPLVIEIKELTRTLAQNALFWAVMTDIAEQVNWHGRKLAKEDWKHVLSAALYQQDVVPNLDRARDARSHRAGPILRRPAGREVRG